MADLMLEAQLRTEAGKGSARRLRASGRVPAVIYGHNTEPVSVSVPALEAARVAKHRNVLLQVQIAGEENHQTLLKDVQRHPVRRHIEHMDLLIVSRGEKIKAEIPLVIEGQPAPGAILGQDLSTIIVETEATHVPEKIVIDVTGREVGQHVSAGELDLPAGTVLVVDADTLVVNISAPQAKDLGAGAEEGAQAAEPTEG